MKASPHNASQLFLNYRQGHTKALETLMPLVYDELRRLAHRYMSRARGDHTLQATALVHEVYLRLMDQGPVHWQNRAHFIGIAKLLNTDAVYQTRELMSGRLMTPEYASPEQVRGETITTASDVYSLGVLLYYLLTGHQPYEFKARTLREIERVICEAEPEKPSTVIQRLAEGTPGDGTSQNPRTPESVSRTRERTVEKLRRRLRGDLDNILLRALHKEPSRRYASVEQFSEDLRRYLEGEPVLARKDTFSYRAEQQALYNRRLLYAAEMNLASQAFEEAYLERVNRHKFHPLMEELSLLAKAVGRLLESGDRQAIGDLDDRRDVFHDECPRRA